MTFLLIFVGGFIILPMIIIWLSGGYDEEPGYKSTGEYRRDRDPTDWYDGGAGV